jgi:hypothetical protein
MKFQELVYYNCYQQIKKKSLYYLVHCIITRYCFVCYFPILFSPEQSKGKRNPKRFLYVIPFETPCIFLFVMNSDCSHEFQLEPLLLGFWLI